MSIKSALGIDVKPAQLAAFNDGTGALFRNETASLTMHKADATSWALSVNDLASKHCPRSRPRHLRRSCCRDVRNDVGRFHWDQAVPSSDVTRSTNALREALHRYARRKSRRGWR